MYQAQLIGSDPLTDIALIKVSGNADFPFVRFAEAEPRIGDWVSFQSGLYVALTFNQR